MMTPTVLMFACIYRSMYIRCMSAKETNPQSIRPAAAAWSIASATSAVALMAFAQLTQPEVVPSWQPLSELALGSTGWATTSGLILLGMACGLLFSALRGQPSSHVAHVGRYALLLGALGGVMTGAFPTDRWDVAKASATGMAHSLASVLFNAIPVASVILGISFVRGSTGWRSRRWWLLAGSAFVVGAAVALSVSMTALMPQSGGLGPDAPMGWQARILLLAEASWITIAARCALVVRKTTPESRSSRSEPVEPKRPAGVA